MSVVKSEIKEEDHDTFQTVSETRVRYAAKTILAELNPNEPEIVVAYGPMAGGKSWLLGLIYRTLRQQKPELSPVLFNFAGDAIRSGNPNKMWTRKGNFSQVIPISNIQDVNQHLNNNQTVVLFNEVSFMGEPEEIEYEVSRLVENGTSVIIGTLGAWFTGEPITAVDKSIALSNTAYCLQPFCSFEPSLPADYTLRTVRITAAGQVLDSHGKYLLTRDPAEVAQIYQNLRTSSFTEQLIGEVGGTSFIRAPSHPEDNRKVIGHQEYFPASAKVYNSLYQSADLPNPNQPVISELYNYPQKIFDWQSNGL